MNKLRSILAALVLAVAVSIASAQQVRHEIAFPDVPGYKTLKCDFHMHTVFSDGVVWPTVRVDEAWREGLDAISITDHIEYQPHKDDLPTKHGRSFDLAAGPAREKNLLNVKGAEITRDTPPGHFNAIFLKDVQPLDTKDFVEVFRRAKQQDAFVFWNHQAWQGREKGRWLDIHTTLYQEKLFHGMEVCNGESYYPDAHRWCLEKNLTMLGNTDIHDPDSRQASLPGNHRTMTLVFAKGRTIADIKDALVQGRTAVWCKNQIIGRREWLEALFQASVKIGKPHLQTKDAVWVEVQNVSDVEVRLQRRGSAGPEKLTLSPRGTSVVKIATTQPEKGVELTYTATNFLIAPKTGLPVAMRVPAP